MAQQTHRDTVKKSKKKVASKVEGPAKVSVQEIESLKNELIKSPKNINKLTHLLNYFKLFHDDLDISEHYAVFRSLLFNTNLVFEHFIKRKLVKVMKNQASENQQVSKWIKNKYEIYQDELIRIWNIHSNDDGDNDDIVKTVKLDVLDDWFKLLKYENKYLNPNQGSENNGFFSNNIYKKFLKSLLSIDRDDYLIEEFINNKFNKYWDLKYYFFNEINEISDSNSEKIENIDLFISNIIQIIEKQDLYDLKNEEGITELLLFNSNSPKNTIYNINNFKLLFEKSWIKLLNYEIKKETYFKILNVLHKRIIPFMSNASKLMDFLTISYTLGIKNKDCLLSILSLNGLWELMKNYNLEYPLFYNNLYLILTPDLLNIKEKSRFFRILEIFLSSTHLSSTIVASFIKKLSRLSLTSTPSGLIILVPFIYNLIKKYGHSTCMLLIHSTTTKEEDLKYEDPFDNLEKDPSLTNAIDSSIWELEIMINHYHPNISSLIKIFNQYFNKYNYNIEDFLDWDYNKLIKQEENKKMKGEIGIEFNKFDKLSEYLNSKYDY